MRLHASRVLLPTCGVISTLSSLSSLSFAAVAGGENFRHHRNDRNRHRFYRKFLYPVIKYKQTFCVACGRCVRSCLVHISVVDTVNHFVEKSQQGGAR